MRTETPTAPLPLAQESPLEMLMEGRPDVPRHKVFDGRLLDPEILESLANTWIPQANELDAVALACMDARFAWSLMHRIRLKKRFNMCDLLPWAKRAEQQDACIESLDDQPDDNGVWLRKHRLIPRFEWVNLRRDDCEFLLKDKRYHLLLPRVTGLGYCTSNNERVIAFDQGPGRDRRQELTLTIVLEHAVHLETLVVHKFSPLERDVIGHDVPCSRAFWRALGRAQKLRKLHLSATLLSALGIRGLESALSELSNLTDLRIDGTMANQASIVPTIASYLAAHPRRLRSLALRNHLVLCIEAWLRMPYGLSRAINLEKLDLAGCETGGVEVSLCLGALQHLPNLTYLDISSNGQMHHVSPDYLSELSRLTSLRTLKMAHMWAYHVGHTGLLDGLTELPNLTELDLRGTWNRDLCLDQMAPILGRMKGLVSLRMDANTAPAPPRNMGEDFVSVVSGLVALEHLEIGGTGSYPYSRLPELERAVAGLPKLKYTDIGDNITSATGILSSLVYLSRVKERELAPVMHRDGFEFVYSLAESIDDL